jgi:8-oxo-dGTP pyrophosphatase MutT (NUDIX family)
MAKKQVSAETKNRSERRAVSKKRLQELMSVPLLGAVPQTGAVVREAGVLAVKRKKNGKPKFLIISKRRTHAWGIPKGRLSGHLTFPETAAKEAFEEAGVVGRISPTAIGMFRTRKRTATPDVRILIEVWVYLLQVTELADDWPEKEKREIRWVSAKDAARYLREPVLAHLCTQIARN